jgi:predicted AAA+ superfamily ATPase
MHPPPLIFDEMQYAPDLLPYIKEQIDSRRGDVGQYLLTGSQNLLLLERVTESLAGRAAILKLLPLSQREALGYPHAPLRWECETRRAVRQGLSYLDLWRSFLRGGYPELVVNPDRDFALWHAGYIQTYLERDLRSIRQIGDLTLFQSFLRALAVRSGQLVNFTEMARDLGVAVNTIKNWISALEATFQIMIVRPYFANVGKRLVKTPKIYFTDVGTLCYLAHIKEPENAAAGPMAGAIFETAVVAEIAKTLLHRGEEPRIYFWRTASGAEVDIIVERNGDLVPLEVKLSATPRPAMAAAIDTFKKDFGKRSAGGYVVHPGDTSLPLAPGVVALPFAQL